MAITRDALVSDIGARLGDAVHAVWTAAELADLVDRSIEGLYPAFFQREIETTTAEAGPKQLMPSYARNLYFIGLLRSTSTRIRKLRGWLEGDTYAIVPKTGIDGETLAWAWTHGWSAPALGTDTLEIPTEAVEVVILRVQIAAMEKLISDSVKQEKYHALFVRHVGGTEEDIATTLDALHVSLRERLERAIPLPEVER